MKPFEYPIAEKLSSVEDEKEKFLQLGKFTGECPQRLLDKVSLIDNSNIDEEYAVKVLAVIAEEFDPRQHQVSSTNNLRTSRLISAQEALDKRQNSCGSMATVVAAVFRKLKIPTKLIHGLYIRNNPQMRHAWNEIFLNDWSPFDVTRPDSGFKLDEFHVKKLEAIDWAEFEDRMGDL